MIRALTDTGGHGAGDGFSKRMRRLRRPAWLGTIRRTTPLSDVWGRDRGTPVDRWYIERFLGEERGVIRGRVLELLDGVYTQRFGSEVERTDVLDIDPGNSGATLIADLAAAAEIPSDLFDCFILTQTLQFVYDFRAAVFHAHRMLRPGGTLLCTVPAVSRIARRSLETEYWRFTTASCARLFADAFAGGTVAVRSYGNVLTSLAFLVGMAAEELSESELAHHDPYFPLIVVVRATKVSGIAASDEGAATGPAAAPR